MKLDEVQKAAQEQFAKQSHFYWQGHILQEMQDVHNALSSLTLPSRAKVLDVATGAGHTGLYIANLGHDVTLSDIAQPMLDHAAKAAAERGLTVQTQQHTAEQLPYADAEFDLVTCRVAAHHFSSPNDFVHETARVLKPGGYFILIDNSMVDDERETEEWLHQVEKLRDPSHNRIVTQGAWSKLCTANGLTVRSTVLILFKQPDIKWYFETAATTPENQKKVLDLVANAPQSVHRLLKLTEEDGKTVWWWPRITLVAQKT